MPDVFQIRFAAGIDWRMSARIARSPVVSLLSLVLIVLVSCAGGGGGGRDPIEVAFDGEAKLRDRVRAIESIWADAERGDLPRDLTRERLTDIAWAYGELEPIRRAAIEALLSDRTVEGDEDSRTTFLAMLPTEPSPALAEMYIEAIVEREWEGAEAALVRSLSRPLRGVALEDRPEGEILIERGEGRSLDEIVFGVFVATPVEGGSREDDLIARRTREDAWNLLNLVSPDRARVGELIRETTSEDPWLVALRKGESAFGVVPMTGQELAWLVRLGGEEHAGWWGQAKAAHDALGEEDRRDVTLRLLEPLRWARAHRPAWFESSRGTLISDLRARLDGRRVHRRSADQVRRDRPNDEGLDDWLDRLSRLDLVSILVVDEAVQSERVQRVVFEELRADLEDKRSEYGGLIEASENGTLRARAFRPRSSERGGDTVYIAPPDLFINGATSLAFWHLHARDLIGREYAGPSRPDLIGAAASGRTSLVFTSLGHGRIDADIYLPNGAAIDLGEFRESIGESGT